MEHVLTHKSMMGPNIWFWFRASFTWVSSLLSYKKILTVGHIIALWEIFASRGIFRLVNWICCVWLWAKWTRRPPLLLSLFSCRSAAGSSHIIYRCPYLVQRCHPHRYVQISGLVCFEGLSTELAQHTQRNLNRRSSTVRFWYGLKVGVSYLCIH